MASSTLTPYKRLAALLPQAVPASDVQPEALANSQDHSNVLKMDVPAQSGMTSSTSLIKDWPIFCRKHYQHSNLVENLWHEKQYFQSLSRTGHVSAESTIGMRLSCGGFGTTSNTPVLIKDWPFSAPSTTNMRPSSRAFGMPSSTSCSLCACLASLLPKALPTSDL